MDLNKERKKEVEMENPEERGEERGMKEVEMENMGKGKDIRICCKCLAGLIAPDAPEVSASAAMRSVREACGTKIAGEYRRYGAGYTMNKLMPALCEDVHIPLCTHGVFMQAYSDFFDR